MVSRTTTQKGAGLPVGVAHIKSAKEIGAIARTGIVVDRALAAAASCCVPGAMTREIAAAAARALTRDGAEAVFLGYRQGSAPPFPAAACVSVNEQVVHGIPGERRLCEGDVVGIDVGARLDGWCADAATSVLVPGAAEEIGERVRERTRLIRAAHDTVHAALTLVRPGLRWSVIAGAMESMAREAGFGIVTEYVGHGVGRDLHEPPRVPAYASGFTGADFELAPGMVLAVEPILCAAPEGRGVPRGDGRPVRRVPIRVRDDGWTIETVDGSIAAHAEATFVVTESGARRLAGPAAPGGPEGPVRL